MANDLVSVVIPIYNMGDSIELCVSKLLNQTYENIEIILVDDGSTDCTLERCMSLKERDSRIIVFHTENQGSGPARNTGIDCAKGRYIYFPDADDLLDEDAISILVNAMEEGKYDLIVFGYRSIGSNGRIELLKKYPKMSRRGADVRHDYSDYVAATRKFGIQGAPWNKFFSLDLIKNNRVKYPPLRRHQDEGFISRYMCYCNNIHFIEDVLYTHYLNDLKREWCKYPVDYIESVIGIFSIKKDTILKWNEDDKKTRTIVVHEYVCNIIKSLELVYSPKMKLTFKDKIRWIRKQVNKSQILDIERPDTLRNYHRNILLLLKNNHVIIAMILMRIKVEIEKKGILGILRRRL
ncbi:MAG: glycosyltransferase family 2 protein [Lachnospiraceae bacterium]